MYLCVHEIMCEESIQFFFFFVEECYLPVYLSYVAVLEALSWTQLVLIVYMSLW